MEKQTIKALIFGVAIVLAAFLLGDAYLSRSRPEGTISVTGLGKTDFTSDLIVWEAVFNQQNQDLQTAYAELEKDKRSIVSYLTEKGISEQNMVFSAVSTREDRKSKYSDDGRYVGDEFVGYVLSQFVEIESEDVQLVEQISREITELLNQGVKLYSQPPRYYYTKLSDLKIEMISAATEDARLRAEKISENSGSELGDLVSAQMGIFQITGQNSTESYSWGGTFNTADKEKTASITMKLKYKIED